MGGLFAGGRLTLLNSTVSGNVAADQGGGLTANGLITIDHSTITGNSSQGSGGGIVQLAGMVLRNSIVAGNMAGVLGPDLLLGFSASTPQVRFSILGSNNGNGLTEAPFGSPDINGNLIGGPVHGLLNPMLAPLANNSGPTQTHALLPGSPAINAGDPAFVGPSNTDQRGTGFARVGGGRLDMGAFEVQSTLPDGDFNNDGLYNCLDIDALVGVIAAHTNLAAYDLTGDTLVNLADRDAWLAEAGGVNIGPGRAYRLGDANLNGSVDGSDFGIWNANKFTQRAEWCRADFNADGSVDGSDFGIWNASKFTSSDGGGRLAAGPNGARVGVTSEVVSQATEVNGRGFDAPGLPAHEHALVSTASATTPRFEPNWIPLSRRATKIADAVPKSKHAVLRDRVFDEIDEPWRVHRTESQL